MRLVSQIFGTKVVDYALKFAASVLVARALGPADKGVLAFATLIVAWATILGNWSLMDANIFLTGSRRFSVVEVSWTSLVASLLSGILYVGLLFGLVFLRWVNWPVGRADAYFLLLLSIPFTLVTNNGIGILQGLGLFKFYNWFTVLRSTLFLAGVAAAFWLPEHRLLAIVLVTVISGLVGALALSLYLARLARWQFRLSSAYLKDAFGFGLRAQLRVLLVQVTLRFDQFALGALLAPTYLGW